MSTSVPISITSDFICPWCLVAEVRLAKAIASLPGDIDTPLTWRPYELNPDMPPEGMDRRLYRTRKFGSRERSEALDAGTVEAARGEVTFDYAAIARTPNTRLAHRLSWYAARHARQEILARAVLSAYFTEGDDIGDTVVLVRIAAHHGLDADAVSVFLASDEGLDEVRAQEHEARTRVRGVPHIEIGDTVISGAPSSETLREAILWNARRELPRTVAERAS